MLESTLVQDSTDLVIIDDSTSCPNSANVLGNLILRHLNKKLPTCKVARFQTELDPCLKEDVDLLTGDLTAIKDSVFSSGGETVCFISSLTPLIIRYSVNLVAKLLTQLKAKKNVKKIVTTIHSDCHNQADCEIISGLADLSISLTELGLQKARVCHLTKSGKCSVTIENIVVTSSESFKSVEYKHEIFDSAVAKESSSADEQQQQPNSSFKLDLTEEERKARDKLELPFWKRTEGEAKIEYVPDANDDWDDEDPDEDLDF